MSEHTGDIYLRRHVRPKKSEQATPKAEPVEQTFTADDCYEHESYPENRQGIGFWLMAILGIVAIMGLVFLMLLKSYPPENKSEPQKEQVPENSNGMVLLQQEAIIDWMRFSGEAYYPEKKAQALSLSASQSDNLLLGFYEQYQRAEEVESAVHYLLAGLGGYVHGKELLDGLRLTQEEKKRVKARFIDYHTRNGGRGFLRLGQLYLDSSYKKSGPMAVADKYYDSYLEYLPIRSDKDAYMQFQMAASCGYGEASDWLSYMAPIDRLTAAERTQLKMNAEGRLADLIADSKATKKVFCDGDAYPYEVEGSKSEKNDEIAGAYLDDASKAYRDRGERSFLRGDDGKNCKTIAGVLTCDEKTTFLSCTEESRYYLNLGKAEMAVGSTGKARAYFSESIKVGRKCGAESSLQASRLLGALNLTCEYSSESLAKISRDGDQVIDLRVRQKALSALGHYQGKVDGKYGQMTRRAVTDFQRELGFQETGDLSPIETVYLFCSAADNARDRNAKNILGLMYVTGLGVNQNTDTGLLWLKDAAESGDVGALYNLAIIYGSGTVLNSYRLCDVVENTQRADAYLIEAARANHPIAKELLSRYGKLQSEERWEKIVSELEQTKFYKTQLKKVGKACPVSLPSKGQQGADNADVATTSDVGVATPDLADVDAVNADDL